MTQNVDTDADPFATSLAGRRLGRYEVLARLASGGMASVYVARALGVAGFERLFAVKVLHPHLAHEQEFISMFLDEARLAARIRHPNVVATIDISDTEDAGYYLVMDYIDGDHLGALLQHAFKQGERLPPPVTLRIIVDALDGLAAAHSLVDESGRPLNLVHRDVSPHNIMVCTDGVARLTDFGVAKAESRLGNTRNGQFKGKLAYMSPEHASNGEADQRSDLFAMGIVLWESLAGRRLFRAENQAATLNKICLEPIPLLSEVDPALAPFDEVVARGLARNPDERFQTAHEFAEAIEQHAAAIGGVANPRAVAKVVREYAAEKIARDQHFIREAISRLSLAPPPDTEESGAYLRGSERPPETSGAHPSLTSSVATSMAAPAAPAEAEADPALPGLADSLEPEAPNAGSTRAANRRTLWTAAVLLGLAAGVAVATLLWGAPANDSDVPSSTDSKPTTSIAPTAAPIGTSPPEVDHKSSAIAEPNSPSSPDTTSSTPPAPTHRATHPHATSRTTPTTARPTGTTKAQPASHPDRPTPRPSRNTAGRSNGPPAPTKPSDDDLLLNPYR